jgi:hypothetical protein
MPTAHGVFASLFRAYGFRLALGTSPRADSAPMACSCISRGAMSWLVH